MRRIVLIVFGIALVFVPVVLLAIVNREAIFKQLRLFSFLVRPMRSEQFAVKSSVPHFTPKLVNTSFLDYVMSTMNIFEKDAIVDPDIYWKSKGIKTRYTVSRIQIELVPTLERYMLALGGIKNDFGSRGTYAVVDDTLVIQVSLNPEEIPTGGANGQYALEDLYLHTALQVLVYAVGTPGKPMDPKLLEKIDASIREYLETGIFTRPIVIEKTGT